MSTSIKREPTKPVLAGPIPSKGIAARRPPWLRVKVTRTDTHKQVDGLLSGLRLNTVCEEARCPNIWECWGQHRTATFMILGAICTRACRYCSVTSGRPERPDPLEPERVAQAVERLELKHAVVTSVDRDDLPDHGAQQFIDTIHAIRKRTPACRIEILTPDFNGETPILESVLDAGPDIFAHNVETVQRLHPRMRSRGDYQRTLQVLADAHAYRQRNQKKMTTKSGVMVGLGETLPEIFALMDDLRAVSCDVLTVGQYLNPTNTKKHAPIDRFYTPDEFKQIRSEARRKGFLHCESGPLVRSSYHAHEHVPK